MKVLKESLKIFFILFRKPLFVSTSIVFISFFIITTIPIIINSYNESLENSLATKQPHIIVNYFSEDKIFSNKELIDLEKEIVKNIGENKIKEINAYVKDKLFVNLKSYGNNLSEFSGYIDLIGITSNHFPICYDFDSFTPVMLDGYGFKITGIEMFEEFKNREETLFFNSSLYYSIQPKVTYEAVFEGEYYIHNQKIVNKKGSFLGIVEDFYSKPIIYMNSKYLNKILGYDKDHYSGLMINIRNQKELVKIKKALELFFNSDRREVSVSTWRELNKKQNDIFKIFTQVGEFLKWIILILATSAVSIYLYKSLLMKQPELRLLNILGLRLTYIVNITIMLSSLIAVILSTYLADNMMRYVYSSLLEENLRVDVSFYIKDILLSYTILFIVTLFIVNNLFKQKYNIFK